ncbi:MAG: acyl-CoA reductase, partial [Oscillibacter sp.]|nr:acyl-CoA reductase [Oscillibacter sp.]
ELTRLLARSGVNRVTRAGSMSHTFPGEAHDGEYPLRRYQRMVDIQA